MEYNEPPLNVTIDLRRIAHIRHSKGWAAPSPDNIHNRLLLTVGEIIEAQNELRSGHTMPEVYYAAELGWWCKAHHDVFCQELDCISHPVCRVTSEGESPVEIEGGKWERYELSKPEGFGVEIADAIMRLADIAFCNGIDLQRCLDEKQAYNAQRPLHHGGKKF